MTSSRRSTQRISAARTKTPLWKAQKLLSILKIITTRKRSLGQGNIFTPVCHSVHKGGHAWLFRGGGACVVALGGVHGCPRGVGVCGCSGEACIVLFRGGMHGFFSFFGYNEIRSMSGWYASYWNAFLFEDTCTEQVIRQISSGLHLET